MHVRAKKKTASFHFYPHTIPVRSKLPTTRFTNDNVHFQRKNIAQEILLYIYPNLVEIRLPNIFSALYLQLNDLSSVLSYTLSFFLKLYE